MFQPGASPHPLLVSSYHDYSLSGTVIRWCFWLLEGLQRRVSREGGNEAVLQAFTQVAWR